MKINANCLAHFPGEPYSRCFFISPAVVINEISFFSGPFKEILWRISILLNQIAQRAWKEVNFVGNLNKNTTGNIIFSVESLSKTVEIHNGQATIEFINSTLYGSLLFSKNFKASSLLTTDFFKSAPSFIIFSISTSILGKSSGVNL